MEGDNKKGFKMIGMGQLEGPKRFGRGQQEGLDKDWKGLKKGGGLGQHVHVTGAYATGESLYEEHLKRWSENCTS